MLNGFQNSTDYYSFYSVFRMKYLIILKGMLNPDKISVIVKSKDSILYTFEEKEFINDKDNKDSVFKKLIKELK